MVVLLSFARHLNFAVFLELRVPFLQLGTHIIILQSVPVHNDHSFGVLWILASV
jgi:hypothetical protein